MPDGTWTKGVDAHTRMVVMPQIMQGIAAADPSLVFLTAASDATQERSSETCDRGILGSFEVSASTPLNAHHLPALPVPESCVGCSTCHGNRATRERIARYMSNELIRQAIVPGTISESEITDAEVGSAMGGSGPFATVGGAQ